MLFAVERHHYHLLYMCPAAVHSRDSGGKRRVNLLAPGHHLCMRAMFTQMGVEAVFACAGFSCFCISCRRSASTPWHQVSASRASGWESRRHCCTRGPRRFILCVCGQFYSRAPRLLSMPLLCAPLLLHAFSSRLPAVHISPFSVHHACCTPNVRSYRVCFNVSVCVCAR